MEDRRRGFFLTSPYHPLNSPFKWVGGKKKLRDKIIEIIPTHTCYVEVFGGAAWVLFGKPPSPVEVYNDIDHEVVNFFRVVRQEPQKLLSSFEYEIVSREEFDRLKETDPNTLDSVSRAHRFYYLIMAGWGGELDYPRFQTSIADGGHGNRLLGALETMRKRIEPIHSRLKTVVIENLTWQALVQRYDDERTFMYLDPPYPDNNVNYQHNMRKISEHVELRDWMKNAKSKLLLTSYDKPEIRSLYDGFRIRSVDFASGMVSSGGKRRNREIIVTNFDIEGKVDTVNKIEWSWGSSR
jgi:DNA adenine methylase